MAFLSRSRLFGLLLILASLPLDPGTALATGMATNNEAGSGVSNPSDVMEARLRRIAAAVREQQPVSDSAAKAEDELAYVYIGPNGLGWSNGGGWGNGFRNGGFGNGGFWNGGFRNGGWGNGGGWRNGGAWRNGGGDWRNGGGFRNYW